jgi:S-adenosylmethionine-diacylgycerolhomoserine-N-methlytransferase
MTDSYQDNPDQRILKHKLSKYYHFQSQIYDFTRWSFLLGRKRLIKEVSRQLQDAKRITEFGCGTGTYLLILSSDSPTPVLLA